MPGVVAEADLIADATALEREVRRQLATLRLVMEPPTAEVRVNAEVMPDGRGEAMRAIELNPGSQEVEVSAPGVAPQRFTISPRRGEELLRRVNLAVVPGRVAVSVDQREATVSIDDEVVGHGNTVWQGAPGAHRVRVEAEGYRPYRRPVTVVAGGDLRVEVTLASARAPWFQSPWLWGGIGLAVIGGVVAALLIEHDGAPDGGSTQQVFQGASVRW
jgi:hypothetical protein